MDYLSDEGNKNNADTHTQKNEKWEMQGKIEIFLAMCHLLLLVFSKD